jgi:Lipocalin-like domain
MKEQLALGAVSLFVGMAAILGLAMSGTQVRADNQRIQDRFIGAWRLASLEEPDTNGNLHRADCTGMLVFARDGHMSVQVMYRNAPTAEAGAAPVQYALGGYEASFGTYQINKEVHTFAYHVEGALVRTLVGKDFTRVFEISGNQLTVKSSDPSEHWEVAWERY